MQQSPTLCRPTTISPSAKDPLQISRCLRPVPPVIYHHDLREIAACTVAFAAIIIFRRRSIIAKRLRNRQPQSKFLRAAMLHFVGTKPLHLGNNSSVVVSPKIFSSRLIFHAMLSWVVSAPFDCERVRFNFGSPYRRGQKKRSPSTNLSLDLLGMALWYIKTSGSQNALSTIFGLVHSSVRVWIDYAMYFMLRTVKKLERKDFEVP